MDDDKFLHAVGVRLGTEKEETHRIVGAVLHELHDRLTVKEADDLGAQFPGEIKRIWHGFDWPGREVQKTHKTDFVRHVSERADIGEDVARRAVMAVFKAIQMAIRSPTGQEGEAWDVLSQLPKDLKRVWLAAARMEPQKPKAIRSNAP
jgi:uncharacterized protein (DUF2267 family)